MLLLTACCKHAETTFELALPGDDEAWMLRPPMDGKP